MGKAWQAGRRRRVEQLRAAGGALPLERARVPTSPRPPEAPPSSLELTRSEAEQTYGICLECGRSHAPENRQRLIAPMQHLPREEIREAWPCFYPDGSEAVGQRLRRDLEAIRKAGDR